MTEVRALLADTATKAFRDMPAEFADGWKRVQEAGFALLLVPEADGGFGGGWEDVNAVLRAAGTAAVNLPLADAIIANSFSPDEGFGSIAAGVHGSLSGDRFTGEMRGVAFGAQCGHVVAQLDSASRFNAPKSAATIAREYTNVAGEQRADLLFDGAKIERLSRNSMADLFHLGALARVCQIAGAMEAMLAMTIEHAKTRQQFGRAIGNFQAIQQQLAVFASETAAVGAAASSACRAVDREKGAFEIASAKLRANKAIDIATSVAHQIHGAIGITQEHALHKYTQRLWAWKSEYGNDRHWAEKLGGEIAAQGADAFWPALTTS
jgi:acyl-CoA dehydrogenase